MCSALFIKFLFLAVKFYKTRSLSASQINYVDPPPPVGWGSTYCFTAVGVHVTVTPITKGTPAQNFFWEAWFLFPRALAFDSFCYDLDVCSQGQAVRVFFI